MSNLPTPKSKSGWIVSVFIALFLFLIYYVYLFENIVKLYTDQSYTIPYQQVENLEVTIIAPHKVYTAESSWLYVFVTNNKDNPIYDVNVYINTKSIADSLLLPSLYSDDTYNRELNFKVIEKYSTVTGRIKVISQKDLELGTVFLEYSDNRFENPNEPLELIPAGTIPPSEIDHIAGLRRSFIEIILLPPWSNGFLLALVLFSVYLAECIPVPNQFRARFNSIVKRFWWVGLISLIFSFLFFGVIYVFLIIPEGFLPVGLVICILFIIVGSILFESFFWKENTNNFKDIE